MKKIILLASLLLCSLTQAQIITATGNGEAITEGKTFTFNSLEEGEATLTLVAKNVTTNPIYLKLKVNSITNADGTSVQFCFGGLCYFSIEEGDTVPANNVLKAIPAGETNVANDHFYNENAGVNAAEKVSYNLSFVQVDETGKELATLLTFNYNYSPTASLTSIAALKNMGITVNNTVVKNVLDITATQNTTLEVYTLNSQKVKTVALKNGFQSVDLSALSTGVYFANFTSNSKRSSIKIVKN